MKLHARSGINNDVIVFLALNNYLNANTRQNTASSYTEPKQTWNYVNIRKDAYMFWWLYYTTAVEGYTSLPLVIWLQVCALVMFETQYGTLLLSLRIINI